MPALTLTQAKEHLSQWLAADLAVSKGQSYTIKDRTLTRVNSGQIRKNLDYWRTMVNKLERGGGIRVRQALIRDT
jgi:antitoxin (DNA-binding transcriptional repressor) of toxin-antitoxin stability system